MECLSFGVKLARLEIVKTTRYSNVRDCLKLALLGKTYTLLVVGARLANTTAFFYVEQIKDGLF